MTAIAVGVSVNPHQPVMKPCGDFIGAVGLMRDPIAAVIEKLPDIQRDAIGRNIPDILGAAPVTSSPAP
jgi:hypothetical protein